MAKYDLDSGTWTVTNEWRPCKCGRKIKVETLKTPEGRIEDSGRCNTCNRRWGYGDQE